MLYGEVVVAPVQSAIGFLAVVRQPGPLANENELYRTRFLGHKFVSCGGPE